MYKKIALGLITIAALVSCAVFAYSIFSEQQRKDNEEKARSECSEFILPRASENLKYAEFNKCMAGKGFSDTRH
jgi:hypothetical protein